MPVRAWLSGFDSIVCEKWNGFLICTGAYFILVPADREVVNTAIWPMRAIK